MARNGSGTYSRVAGTPYTYNTVIDQVVVNSEMDDIATALTNSLAKNGETTPTANLPMGTFKHTGVGEATARTDYARASQVQDSSLLWCSTAGGTADAFTLTPSPAITAYAAGQAFHFLAVGTNTGAVTVNVSSVGAKAVQASGSALTGGEIVSGKLYAIRYDGTQFQLECVSVTPFIATLLNDSNAVAALATLGARGIADDVTLAAGKVIIFEGATDDAFETTLSAADPTADRTITLPDQTGTVKVMARGTDIASAGTINLTTATGDIVDVTGTTAITAITLADGIERTVRFTGALTLTHGASLVLPSAANISTADGDVATFRGYAAGVVRCTAYQKASGQAIVGSGITLGTATASTSGTSIDFTSIPAGTKRITINFSGVSTNGTSVPILQLGDSGGVENTGYTGTIETASSRSSFTDGFKLVGVGSAAWAMDGRVVLELLDDATNTWTATIAISGDNAAAAAYTGAGAKSTSATLDRVRITTQGGADTFDAGKINIQYE